MDKIPVIISLDVEPDTRTNLEGGPAWRGFEVLCTRMSRLRAALARATGSPARFTWLLRMDAQIQHAYGRTDWVIEQYRQLIEALIAAGDEIGVHTHAWRWKEPIGWVADHGDEAWVEHCLRISFRTYRASFGRRARVFRFGDRFLSNRVVRWLDRKRVVCDLTMEPGRQSTSGLCAPERTTGTIPDYSAAPRRPYRPSRRNYQSPGRLWKRNLWIFPLTTGRPVAAANPAAATKPDHSTLLLGAPFPIVRELVDMTLATESKPFLSAVARSEVLLDRFNGEQFEQLFAYLLEHPSRSRFVFESAPDALRRVA
jgi:hypothetical protein